MTLMRLSLNSLRKRDFADICQNYFCNKIVTLNSDIESKPCIGTFHDCVGGWMARKGRLSRLLSRVFSST